MFTFDSEQLSQLFYETYHQPMSVKFILCSRKGGFIEFKNRISGRLFYLSERIYATAYSGGSSDPGVCVELKFGNVSEVHIMELLDRKVAPGDTEQLTMSDAASRETISAHKRSFLMPCQPLFLV